VAADSTSINLYKILSAALSIVADDPRRTVNGNRNFPCRLRLAPGLHLVRLRRAALWMAGPHA
jgi:kynureninase